MPVLKKRTPLSLRDTLPFYTMGLTFSSFLGFLNLKGLDFLIHGTHLFPRDGPA